MDRLPTTDEFQKIDRPLTRNRLIADDHPAIPAIAIPIQNKSAFECPLPHLGVLKDVIQETTRVLTIGWRGQEAHFCNLWANRNGFFPMLVVAGREEWAREALANMTSLGIHSEAPLIHPAGFSELLSSTEFRDFLNKNEFFSG